MDAPANLPDADGVISSDCAYRLDTFKSRLKLNDDALRKARRKGLKARRVGRRKFILGDEAIQFLKSCPEV